MELANVKLVTVICESDLEATLAAAIIEAGAKGYTVTDARGRGHRGVRNALWGASANVRFDILCAEPVARRILEMIENKYFKDYGMVMYVTDAEVLRANKF